MVSNTISAAPTNFSPFPLSCLPFFRYSPLWTLMTVYCSSSRSIKTAGGHHTHARTDSCHIAHARDVHQSRYSTLQLFIQKPCRRWTALYFSCLLCINTKDLSHIYKPKSTDSLCCVLVEYTENRIIGRSIQLEAIRNKNPAGTKYGVYHLHPELVFCCLFTCSGNGNLAPTYVVKNVDCKQNCPNTTTSYYSWSWYLLYQFLKLWTKYSHFKWKIKKKN